MLFNLVETTEELGKTSKWLLWKAGTSELAILEAFVKSKWPHPDFNVLSDVCSLAALFLS